MLPAQLASSSAAYVREWRRHHAAAGFGCSDTGPTLAYSACGLDLAISCAAAICSPRGWRCIPDGCGCGRRTTSPARRSWCLGFPVSPWASALQANPVGATGWGSRTGPRRGRTLPVWRAANKTEPRSVDWRVESLRAALLHIRLPPGATKPERHCGCCRHSCSRRLYCWRDFCATRRGPPHRPRWILSRHGCEGCIMPGSGSCS